MTDKEWADKRCAEREIKRLAECVAALERRIRAAEGEARAARNARDVALALAADPWRARPLTGRCLEAHSSRDRRRA
jgi:hypothetical protein